VEKRRELLQLEIKFGDALSTVSGYLSMALFCCLATSVLEGLFVFWATYADSRQANPVVAWGMISIGIVPMLWVAIVNVFAYRLIHLEDFSDIRRKLERYEPRRIAARCACA
jgi:hypothetical protein